MVTNFTHTGNSRLLVRTYSTPGQCILDLFEVFHGTPALSNEATLGHIKIKHIHSVVDSFDLLHLCITITDYISLYQYVYNQLSQPQTQKEKKEVEGTYLA